MDQQQRQKYTKLLFDIGVVGTHHSLFSETDNIMQVLIAVNPDKEEPIIGMGYNLMSWGKAKQAADLFKEKSKPLKQVSPMYDAMTGFALFLAKQYGEAERLLTAVKARSNNDPAAMSLAEGLLVEMRNT